MRLVIDTDKQILNIADEKGEREIPLYCPAAFEIISRQWLRIGWALQYYMTFSWWGRAVIQIPEDLVRFQEVFFLVQPDYVIETGVYKGGSLLFYASLCRLLGKGKVVGIDIHVPKEVRQLLSQHPLGDLITVIEGNSTSRDVFCQVSGLVPPGSKTMIVLDSDHSKAHVREELELYSLLTSRGSVLVVADGLMADLWDVPGGNRRWADDNPLTAVKEFLSAHPEFSPLELPRLFWESPLTSVVTHWPHGWLVRNS